MTKWLIDYFTIERPKNKSRKTADPEDTVIRPILRYIMKITGIVTCTLLLSLIFFFCTNKLFALFSVLMLMAAYFISGTVLGFIFGIPKKYQNKQATVQVDKDGKPLPSSDPGYTDNTSLEEISDWITKIIIGLSLVQFNYIKNMVEEAALNIRDSLQSAYSCSANGLNSSPLNFYTFSYSIIIFYSIAGAIIGYLWTRVEFPRILAVKDKLLRDVDLKKGRILDDTIKTLNQELTANLDNLQIHSATNNPDLPNFELIYDSRTNLIQQITDNTPAGPIPDDPQKNRWGGASAANNLLLTAEVSVATIPSLYRVKITVSTKDQSPLTDIVAILLHPSFEPPTRIIDPKGNNTVFVEVIAYEAFTVAALCNVKGLKDYTGLELDLNELPSLPSGFYWRR